MTDNSALIARLRELGNLATGGNTMSAAADALEDLERRLSRAEDERAEAARQVVNQALDLAIMKDRAEAAEARVKELERLFTARDEQLTAEFDVSSKLSQRARAAEALVKELEAALRFYAEPWKFTDTHGDDVRVPDFYSELDFGETARAALSPAPAQEDK